WAKDQGHDVGFRRLPQIRPRLGLDAVALPRGTHRHGTGLGDVYSRLLHTTLPAPRPLVLRRRGSTNHSVPRRAARPDALRARLQLHARTDRAGRRAGLFAVLFWLLHHPPAPLPAKRGRLAPGPNPPLSGVVSVPSPRRRSGGVHAEATARSGGRR